MPTFYDTHSTNMLCLSFPTFYSVCQTFEDDLCDPFFDSLDSMSPPGPEWKNVSYDPVQYDSGDVPFDPLPELEDWQDAATFGSCKFLCIRFLKS